VHQTLTDASVPPFYLLNWRWTFNISGGTERYLAIEAGTIPTAAVFQFVLFNSETQQYTFLGSITDGGTDPDSYRYFKLPDGITGNVYIEVSDGAAQNTVQSSLIIDHMFIRVICTPTPTPTETPTPTDTPTPTETPTPNAVKDWAFYE